MTNQRIAIFAGALLATAAIASGVWRSSDTLRYYNSSGVETTLAYESPVGTLAYSGTTVTVTAGKGSLQEDELTCTNSFTLEFSGLATKNGGTIRVWPAATNCTVTLASYCYSPSGTTLTIMGGTGNTNYTEIAWKNGIVNGTNRVSVNAVNYYR